MQIRTYLISNGYINTNVKKGDTSVSLDCLEHTSPITHRRSKDQNSDLKVVRFALDNPYGSVPHKVVEYAINQYHLP